MSTWRISHLSISIKRSIYNDGTDREPKGNSERYVSFRLVLPTHRSRMSVLSWWLCWRTISWMCRITRIAENPSIKVRKWSFRRFRLLEKLANRWEPSSACLSSIRSQEEEKLFLPDCIFVSVRNAEYLIRVVIKWLLGRSQRRLGGIINLATSYKIIENLLYIHNTGGEN